MSSFSRLHDVENTITGEEAPIVFQLRLDHFKSVTQND